MHLPHVKVDNYGVTTVDLGRVAYASEPFVLAKQVHQVFYIVDLCNKKRHVVRNGKRSIVGVDEVVDEDDYNTYGDIPNSEEVTCVEI